MAWYNGGNWEGLGAAHLAYIIRDLMKAINQRNEAIGDTPHTWIAGAVDPEYPTAAEVAAAIGPLNGSAMRTLIGTLRSQISSLRFLQRDGLTISFVDAENSEDIIYPPLGPDWEPDSVDAGYYVLNAAIWDQMRDILDEMIYIKVQMETNGLQSLSATDLDEALINFASESDLSGTTEERAQDTWDAAVAAAGADEADESIGGLRAVWTIASSSTSLYRDSRQTLLPMGLAGTITKEIISVAEYASNSAHSFVSEFHGETHTYGGGTLSGLITEYEVSGVYAADAEVNLVMDFDSLPSDHPWTSSLSDGHYELAFAINGDNDHCRFWLDISGELDDQS